MVNLFEESNLFISAGKTDMKKMTYIHAEGGFL
jgi:hypothetical protein